jgi:indole-3-glycerol phosphate synthase
MFLHTTTILDRIFSYKQDEVENLKRQQPLHQVRTAAESYIKNIDSKPTSFLSALREPSGDGPALIAEIKRASPSRGLLASDIEPSNLARLYQENGAAAISVLTDEKFFQGSLEDLSIVAECLHGDLPLLRKDFIFDPYQLYRARLAGASAVLLIVACLHTKQLAELMVLCQELEMTPLVEVHNSLEVEAALGLNIKLLGINNRDLHTFNVDLETTLRLRPDIPPEVLLVSESGIHTKADVRKLQKAGVDAILVGEALVTAPIRAAKIRELACYG